MEREKVWDCEVKECECPCHEEEEEGAGVELTRADILPILFCIWIAFNVVFGVLGTIYGSSNSPNKYTSPDQWHAQPYPDQCDLHGKWNYVLIGFTGGCRFSRWMAE